MANFALQSSYLVVHLLFIFRLLRVRQPTPIWTWFFLFCVTTWLWVSGRFMETIVYLFLPTNNDAYVFAANYQYLGDTTAVAAYVIWNLHLAGHDRLASNRLFLVALFAYPAIVCILVFTNHWHHLIYTKLVMNQRVMHGPLFAPCLIGAYAILIAGYLVSLGSIVREGRDVGKKVLVFSVFPALPALAVLVRSLSGADRLDYTPIIMAASLWCLYLIVFGYGYVNIIPASIEAVLEQTSHPIGIYDTRRGVLTYSNRIASERYLSAGAELLSLLSRGQAPVEGVFDGRSLKVDLVPLPDGRSVLVTATDMTDIKRQRAQLDGQIRKLEELSRELEEENRNIDAYLGSLYQVDRLEQKQHLIAHTYRMIEHVFDSMESNLRAAKADRPASDRFLRENLRLAQTSMVVIRKTVAQLREA